MLNTDPSHTEGGHDLLRQVEWLTTVLANEPDSWALFLDIDGTLIDLAVTPDAIVVPPSLAPELQALSDRLGGALALVTGRALPYADELFHPYRFPIAGLHGSERRAADGQVERVAATDAFEEVKTALTAAAGAWPGVLIEDKGAAVAAHYRQAPEWCDELERAMEYYLLQAGSDFALQRGKMVFEIRPAHADKGGALRTYLSEMPFRGRRPIAVGDDLTDEAMFKVANALGGVSVRIGDATLPDGTPTQASMLLPSAAKLREILAGLAR